jgi:hypothetical protein
MVYHNKAHFNFNFFILQLYLPNKKFRSGFKVQLTTKSSLGLDQKLIKVFDCFLSGFKTYEDQKINFYQTSFLYY